MKISLLKQLYHTNRTEFWRIIRYLIVGGWNTVFGLGLYAVVYYCIGTMENYLWISIPANVIAITNAYICYKLFVFKTRGNIIREYIKCFMVYGSMMPIGLAELYLFVDIFGMNPVIASIVGTVFNTVISYLGHKFFSFRKVTHEK